MKNQSFSAQAASIDNMGLAHIVVSNDGTPDRIRTYNPRSRNPKLYPVEPRTLPVIKKSFIFMIIEWGGIRDSNPRPPAPQTSALTN